MAPSNAEGLINEPGDGGEAAQNFSLRDGTENQRLCTTVRVVGEVESHHEPAKRVRRG